MRDSWRTEFDFTLVDSRTGITEAGGICTIQLPDVLIPVFTCTDQSLGGAVDVAYRARRGQQSWRSTVRRFLFFRFPLALTVVPSLRRPKNGSRSLLILGSRFITIGFLQQ
jgi:hypothetical protein